MNCWNCGKELTDGAAFCTGCGASAARREPETPEGRALRSLLDHYGVEKALESSFRLPDGVLPAEQGFAGGDGCGVAPGGCASGRGEAAPLPHGRQIRMPIGFKKTRTGDAPALVFPLYMG